MLKNLKRNFLAATVSALLLLLAFPLAVSAASLLSVNVDRTSVTPGQTITFSIRTTPGVNYVFAEVGASRVPAQRLSADANGNQNWTLSVQPASTTNIAVFANTTNNTSGAASFSVPVTVGAAGGVTTPVPPTGQVPPATATGPLAIQSITETPALAANQVQLTVVVGAEANEVWVRFDQDRFRRGQEQTGLRTATSRTFVINFQPTSWTSQQVQVSANRVYAVAGATTENYTLTLAAPFVRPTAPAIQQVSVSSRTVTPGSNTTFTIRTNADVEHVWVVDVDGNRHNANRTGQQTATTRNWTVNFNPGRTGSVRVYANATDTTTNAATRTESITVQTATASIQSASAHWTNWQGGVNQTVTVEVRTNHAVQRVWVDLPNGHRPRLNLQSGSGTNDRIWRGYISNVGGHNQLSIRASLTDNYNTDASHTVSVTGQGGGGGNHQVTIQNWGGWLSQVTASHAGANNVSFHIFTTHSVNNLRVYGPWGVAHAQGAGNQWWITPNWNWTPNQNFQLTFQSDGHQPATANWWTSW